MTSDNDNETSSGADGVQQMAQSGRRLPVLTGFVCAIGVVIFLGLNQPNVANDPELYSSWGVKGAAEIRSGALWALVTSTFAHAELWHLAFNLYWLWIFGSILESSLGRVRWAGLYLALAIISSAAELTVGGETGIGASGVIFGFFGFMWSGRRVVAAFQKVISRQIIKTFLIWLWICIIATVADVFRVGNTAHIAGLVAGVLMGQIFVVRKQKIPATAGLALVATLSLAGLVWAPWSYSWKSEQALKAYKERDFDQAEVLIKEALAGGQDKAWCWDMLARTYLAMGDRNRYSAAVEELRNIDSSHATALEDEMRAYLRFPAEGAARNSGGGERSPSPRK